MTVYHMHTTCKKVKYTPCIALVLFIFVGSCTPIISKELRTKVAKEITFKEVLENPEAYKGKVVIWGGVIIGAKNVKEGTLIEVLQKPGDREGRLKDVDESYGRFLALYNGYLDVVIYSRGREVVVAGAIKGKRVLPLGEIEYTYPLILVKEIHLFKVRKDESFYPYPYWWYPPWWYHPYWYPW